MTDTEINEMRSVLARFTGRFDVSHKQAFDLIRRPVRHTARGGDHSTAVARYVETTQE